MPETIKKKQKNFRELKLQHLRNKFAQKMLQKAKIKLIYEKAEHFHKEYRQMYRTEIQMTRMTQEVSHFYVPAEPKLAFVIRIIGISGVSPKVWNVFQLLCLRQIFNGTYVDCQQGTFVKGKLWSSIRLRLTHWELWNYTLSVVIQSVSRVWLLATPGVAACQASLSFAISQSLLKLMSIESVMPSNHLILCRPFLLLPPIPPSIRGFSNE